MSPMYIAKIINLLAIIFCIRQVSTVYPRDGTNNKINNILPAQLHKTSVRDI